MSIVSTACRPITATRAERSQRQHRRAVRQHRHALRGQSRQLLAALGAVGRGQVGGVVALGAEDADPLGQPQQPPQVLVHDLLGHLPGANGVHQRLAPGTVRTGHDQVEAAVRSGRGGLGGEPVGHDQPVPAPLALDHLVDHVVLLGRRDAVHVVVRRHDRPGLRIGDGDLEREQVELPQRRLVDDAVDRVAVGLGLVGDQVLEAGADAERLQPAHVGGGQLAGEQRVLAEGLEEPAAERRAVQVDRRAEHHVDLLGERLLGEDAPHLAHRVVAPGRGEQRGVRQQGHRAAPAELEAADAGRSVGQPQLGEADLGLRGEREGGGPGEEPDLRGQVELADQHVVVAHLAAVPHWFVLTYSCHLLVSVL